jgi:hypothetical protein
MRNWIDYFDKASASLKKLTDEPLPNVWEALAKSKVDPVIEGLNFIYRNADDADSVRSEADHLVRVLKERS